MTANQIPVFFGPPMPKISFWAGNRYLGVTTGLPATVNAARAKLMNAIRSQAANHNCTVELNLLSRASAELSCGLITVALS